MDLDAIFGRLESHSEGLQNVEGDLDAIIGGFDVDLEFRKPELNVSLIFGR